jgi:hypothetical protein
MKPKRLLFALFILYWVGVYGVTFFLSDNFKNKFKGLVPTGYKMYAPITNTNFDVHYHFYRNKELVDSVRISHYIAEEYDKGILWNKTAFAKSKLYAGSLKVLDFHYQTALYRKRYKKVNINLDSLIIGNSKLQKIDQDLKNFAKFYRVENPSLKFDSASISVFRYPTILAFQPDFHNDFTYELGNGIFYRTQIRFEP